MRTLTPMTSHLCRIGALAGLIALLSACSTAPETGRSQLSLLPESQLDAMGAQSFNEMKRELKISHDPEMNARLQRVGKRIVEAARARGADLPPPSQWEFVVFEDEAVNAFALPGGKVGFYTGIFPLFQSDNDLAIVMGHEIAHVSADHGQERVSQQLLAQAGSAGLAVGLGASDVDSDTAQLALLGFGLGAQVGGLLPFSRLQESEADHIGLIYSSSAGYDPRVAVAFWERMGSQGGPTPPEFLSTHPDYRTRMDRLRKLMPEVLPLYQKTRNDFSDYSLLGPVTPENMYAFYHAEARALSGLE